MDINAMNPFTQNSETGEYDFAHNVTVSTHIYYNQETGEPEKKESFDFKRRSKFIIPKNLLKRKTKAPDECKKKTCREELLDQCKTPYQNDFRNGFNKYKKKTYLMFLIIPTIFCFSRCAVFMIMCIEHILHYAAHQMNDKIRADSRMNMGAHGTICYQSPLHIVTSQFCKRCRYSNELNNIHRIHKGYRQHLYRNIRQMAKNFA